MKEVLCRHCNNEMVYDGDELWECPVCGFVIFNDHLKEYLSDEYTCEECGQKFYMDDAQAMFNDRFPGLDYEMELPMEYICGECACKKFLNILDSQT